MADRGGNIGGDSHVNITINNAPGTQGQVPTPAQEITAAYGLPPPPYRRRAPPSSSSATNPIYPHATAPDQPVSAMASAAEEIIKLQQEKQQMAEKEKQLLEIIRNLQMKGNNGTRSVLQDVRENANDNETMYVMSGSGNFRLDTSTWQLDKFSDSTGPRVCKYKTGFVLFMPRDLSYEDVLYGYKGCLYYDDHKRLWKEMDSPKGISDFSFVTCRDKLYVIGDGKKDEARKDFVSSPVQMFDEETQEWVKLHYPFSKVVSEASVASNKNKIYLFGGITYKRSCHHEHYHNRRKHEPMRTVIDWTPDHTKVCQEYEPDKHRSKRLADLPMGGVFSGVVTYLDNFYIVGGEQRACFKYSTATDQFTTLTSPRECHGSQYRQAAVLWEGKILIGGEKGGAYVEEYDPENNTWRDWKPETKTWQQNLKAYSAFCMIVVKRAQ